VFNVRTNEQEKKIQIKKEKGKTKMKGKNVRTMEKETRKKGDLT